MLRFFAPIILLSLSVASYGSPTAPATPKGTLCTWTEQAATWTPEQVLKIYQADGEKEMAFARALAEQASVESQLQKAVHEKWGKEAETDVARAISNDTLADDQASTEKVEGDHATITFKEDAQLTPLYMVRVDGTWKIDVGAFVREFGEQLNATQQFVNASAKVVRAAVNDLNVGKFKDNGELVTYLKSEYEKIDGGK